MIPRNLILKILSLSVYTDCIPVHLQQNTARNEQNCRITSVSFCPAKKSLTVYVPRGILFLMSAFASTAAGAHDAYNYFNDTISQENTCEGTRLLLFSSNRSNPTRVRILQKKTVTNNKITTTREREPMAAIRPFLVINIEH